MKVDIKSIKKQICLYNYVKQYCLHRLENKPINIICKQCIEEYNKYVR